MAHELHELGRKIGLARKFWCKIKPHREKIIYHNIKFIHH